MTDLYGVLGLGSGASEEESKRFVFIFCKFTVYRLSFSVRKAYRKRALQTHPDRLPQSTTAAEKERATEEFRKVRSTECFVTRKSLNPYRSTMRMRF